MVKKIASLAWGLENAGETRQIPYLLMQYLGKNEKKKKHYFNPVRFEKDQSDLIVIKYLKTTMHLMVFLPCKTFAFIMKKRNSP